MKRKEVSAFVLVLFLLILGFFAFVSASVSVHHLNLKQTYSAYEIISGTVNLTITDEPLNSKISSSLGGDAILLGDFLDDNSATYSCSPSDCSDAYDSGSGSDEKTIEVDAEDGAYFGFVLDGTNVQITNLNFSISSNFEESVRIPLELKLFEKSTWKFNQASGNFGPKLWGCYDVNEGVTGPNIGSNFYCGKISVLETPSLRAGADIIVGSGSGNVKMFVYDEFKHPKADCEFDPNSQESCDVSLETGVFSGEYYVCIKAVESCSGDQCYKLKSEQSGETCGWFGLPGSDESSSIDYGVFVRPALYASAQTAGQITIDDGKISNLAADANLFLQDNYQKNCSSDCILPVFIKGVSQNLTISGLSLDYSNNYGDWTNNLIYDADVTGAKVDFSGLLDLSLLGFNVGAAQTMNKTLKLLLGTHTLLLEQIAVLPALITINSVFPLSPPAGVAVRFYASVDSDANISSYSWTFGDAKTEQTSQNSVVHAYQAIGNYTLTLKVADVNGSTATKSFSIKTTSPESAINQTFETKQENLGNITSQINTFPTWQQNALKEIINVSYYEAELDRLNQTWKNASTDADFLSIALSLYQLDIPASIFIGEQASQPLVSDLDDINPQVIQSFTGDGNISGEDFSSYKNQILQWQNENIDATISYKKISLLRESGEREDILIVYSISAKSDSIDESYFVIDKNRNKLSFKQDSSEFVEEGSSTIFVLGSGADESFGFCYEGSDDAVFFVSPALDMFFVGQVGACNFNKVCEPELGEDYENCRSDCKPWTRMILYIILILIFALVVYTILQIWYKTRYEKFLFKDRRYLFNLVMFITNARIKGADDNQIKKDLRKKKYWSNEQMNYALNKASGKRTGMYEIIPVEWFLAYLRQRKAKKNIAAGAVGNIGHVQPTKPLLFNPNIPK